MTFEAMQAVLNRVRYRDVKFVIKRHESDIEDYYEFIAIATQRPCVMTGRLDGLTLTQVIPHHHLPRTEAAVFDLAMRLVQSLEIHEIKEHFVVDGKQWERPHEVAVVPEWLNLQYQAAADAEAAAPKKAS